MKCPRCIANAPTHRDLQMSSVTDVMNKRSEEPTNSYLVPWLSLLFWAQCTHAQLNPFYHPFYPDVTHVRKDTRPSPALPYCKRRKARQGLETTLSSFHNDDHFMTGQSARNVLLQLVVLFLQAPSFCTQTVHKLSQVTFPQFPRIIHLHSLVVTTLGEVGSVRGTPCVETNLFTCFWVITGNEQAGPSQANCRVLF